MGNLSLWLWMLIAVAVFGVLVPGALAAWMIRRPPGGSAARRMVVGPERADELARRPEVFRDLA
ncbi:hypothetical protein P6166_01855 [Stenotrophomonas sp. HITSZ_GD]|uniref:hypothetical protein n=1 Tax=Stenotrophomonas sp. HITSZ_GD TaxID=3037248 RepID=UPI00240D2D6A|nr:hypothetical protein [Stenotrophomonas sp. HITSZ_GD]MDG2524107.1 hypothetical protein [Stenotrophomonas sp. HITSZ_GD]